MPVLLSAVHRDDGATLVEYALLVGVIALIALTAIETIGYRLEDIFANVAAILSPRSVVH